MDFLTVDNHRLDNLGRGVKVDQALVDAQLVHVPGLATLTARGLAGRDLQVLGRQADRALDGQVLGAGTLDQLGADTLQRLDLAARQSDADTVSLLSWLLDGVSSSKKQMNQAEKQSTNRLLSEILLALLVRHFD